MSIISTDYLCFGLIFQNPSPPFSKICHHHRHNLSCLGFSFFVVVPWKWGGMIIENQPHGIVFSACKKKKKSPCLLSRSVVRPWNSSKELEDQTWLRLNNMIYRFNWAVTRTTWLTHLLSHLHTVDMQQRNIHKRSNRSSVEQQQPETEAHLETVCLKESLQRGRREWGPI